MTTPDRLTEIKARVAFKRGTGIYGSDGIATMFADIEYMLEELETQEQRQFYDFRALLSRKESSGQRRLHRICRCG